MSERTREALEACPLCKSRERTFCEPDEYGSGGQHVAPYHAGCSHCRIEIVRDEREDALDAWAALGSPAEGTGESECVFDRKPIWFPASDGDDTATVPDTACQLNNGLWVCSRECWERAARMWDAPATEGVGAAPADAGERERQAKDLERAIIRIGAKCRSGHHDGVHSAIACWVCGGSNVAPEQAARIKELLAEYRAALLRESTVQPDVEALADELWEAAAFTITGRDRMRDILVAAGLRGPGESR